MILEIGSYIEKETIHIKEEKGTSFMLPRKLRIPLIFFGYGSLYIA
jgi:hypothetical protein